MAIAQPLISVFPSTTMLNSAQPLIAPITQSMAISQPLIDFSSISIDNQCDHLDVPTVDIDESVVVKALLGLSEVSDKIMSESLPCEQEKGEVESERLVISSNQEKREIKSSTLVGEGEVVSRWEPLMQEKRDERITGIGKIRKEDSVAEPVRVTDASTSSQVVDKVNSIVS